MGCLRTWLGMLRDCVTYVFSLCEDCKESVDHVLFKCSSYDFQRLIFLPLGKSFLQILLKPFFITAFSIKLHLSGEKQSKLMNDEWIS